MPDRYDVIIVGGGPAGLSAALMLGRCRRRILVCDSGRYRNQASKAVHGFFTRDGTPPPELLSIGRDQLEQYGVVICRGTVTNVVATAAGFDVALDNDSVLQCRRVLLATGVVDQLPDIEGIHDFYGTSVHHCPYCDAWEHRDQPLAAYGPGRSALGLAMSLKTWSRDVVLCTDGISRLSRQEREKLTALEISVRTAPIARLEGEGGQLQRIVFRKGPVLERSAIFFNTGQNQHCDLAGKLGCRFNKRGVIETDRFERTNLPGIFAVGDCARNMQFVAVAAAQGAIAAEAINVELQEEDRNRWLASHAPQQ